MLQVYLVRHGETEWNINGYIQGQSDSKLTELGIKQATLVAERVKSFGITHILSSDLGRAKKTAEIIANLCNCNVTFEPKLRELNMGVLDGRSINSLNNEEKIWYRNLIYGNYEISIPGGETITEITKRMYSVLEYCRTLHIKSRPLLVSHGIGLTTLINYILGISNNIRRRIRLCNCSISKLYYQNTSDWFSKGWIIETIGDISHFENNVI